MAVTDFGSVTASDVMGSDDKVAVMVSTDCGGPSTLITNGSDGYLVPVGVSQILADRVQELLSDEEKRRQFAGNARKKILDSFSDEKTGALFIDVYNRLSEG